MKNKTRLLSGVLLAAGLSLTASLALAEKSQNAPGGPPPRGPHPLLALFDTDKDGVLSADEIANASAVLKALDANGDGQLAGDEFPAPPPPRDPQRSGSGPADSESGGEPPERF